MTESVDAGELPAAPADWTDRADRVEAELLRRYGSTEAWQTAQRQSDRIGALLNNDTIAIRLLVTRPRASS